MVAAKNQFSTVCAMPEISVKRGDVLLLSIDEGRLIQPERIMRYVAKLESELGVKVIVAEQHTSLTVIHRSAPLDHEKQINIFEVCSQPINGADE